MRKKFLQALLITTALISPVASHALNPDDGEESRGSVSRPTHQKKDDLNAHAGGDVSSVAPDDEKNSIRFFRDHRNRFYNAALNQAYWDHKGAAESLADAEQELDQYDRIARVLAAGYNQGLEDARQLKATQVPTWQVWEKVAISETLLDTLGKVHVTHMETSSSTLLSLQHVADDKIKNLGRHMAWIRSDAAIPQRCAEDLEKWRSLRFDETLAHYFAKMRYPFDTIERFGVEDAMAHSETCRRTLETGLVTLHPDTFFRAKLMRRIRSLARDSRESQESVDTLLDNSKRNRGAILMQKIVRGKSAQRNLEAKRKTFARLNSQATSVD